MQDALLARFGNRRGITDLGGRRRRGADRTMRSAARRRRRGLSIF